MKILPGLIVVIVFILAVIAYFFIDTRNAERIFRQMDEEYPPIVINDSFRDKVKNIYHGDMTRFRNNPYHAYVTLINEGKRGIYVGPEINTKATLDETIAIGDIVEKLHNQNRLFIYKIESNDTIRYSFEITDRQGYRLKNE